MLATRRNVLLMLLAVTAGATDATAFERLGHVFASVITGNLVLLGISAAHADRQLALFAGGGLAGYAVGVLLAAPRHAAQQDATPMWAASATRALGAELAVLIAFTVMWEFVDGTPHHGTQVVMLVLCAAAMGVQSTAVRRLGQVSTTYLTSTLTGVFEAVVARNWTAVQTRGVGILTAALGGAAVGTLLIIYGRPWLPIMQLLPLVIVELGSLRLIGTAESEKD